MTAPRLAALRRVSLRTRLVVLVNVLVAVALLGVGVLVYASLRTYLHEQAVQRTREAPLDVLGGDGPGDDAGDGGRARDDDGPPDGVLPDFGPDGVGGPAGPDDDTYVLLVTADGTRLEQPVELDDGRVVTLDVAIPADLPQATDDPDGPAVFRRLSTPDGPFLVKISQFTNGTVLAVGVPVGDEEAVLRRVLVTLVVVSGITLLVVALASRWAVGRGLHPLSGMEAAAQRITDGDVEHRLDVADTPVELRRVGTSLNTMLDRLHDALATSQRSEARMRAFVADASHELRTPVAAIAAYAELFERGAADRPDDLRRAMGGIGREATRASLLIRDLTTLAHDLEDRLARDEVVLADLVHDAVDAALAIDDRWPVTLDLQPDVVVRGDHGVLRQVFDNLLANVRTHTPPGTPTHVTLREEHGVAVVRFADRGPGLDAGQLDLATDRFWRADASRTRATGGSGLGLAIVRAIVEAHGGSVHLQATAPAPGLTVELRLPA